MEILAKERIDGMKNYLLSLSDESGGFRPSNKTGYLGISDALVGDLPAAVQASEIALTLGFELPYPEKTVDYIQARQMPGGYFRSIDPRPGIKQKVFYLYHTCVGLRGLKGFNRAPAYNPRPFLEDYIRKAEFDDFYSYGHDMAANAYVAMDDWMPKDCEERLADFLIRRQDPDTGWIIQNQSYPFERNNPMTFHAARFFHLAGKRVPMADKILENFLETQEDDGSWKKGGVHGTFDACVTIRMLSDNSDKYKSALENAAKWALTCQSADKGFNHFNDGKPSEMDACFFHICTLVMAGMIPTKLTAANKWIGWGHTLLRDE